MYIKIIKIFITGSHLILITSFSYSYQSSGSLEELYRLENLAKLHTGTICKMFSSYDRTGGNDDGFSGAFSKIREENGDSVIAEMSGAGCIQRIWFTHSVISVDGLLNRKSEHIKIYLDGKKDSALDIPLEKLFSGELKQFPKPLVGTSLGGFYCYVPIPYKNGCKVLVEGNGVKYYQITYNEFARSKGIESFSMEMNNQKKAMLDKAVRFWSNPGDSSLLNIIEPMTKEYKLTVYSGKPKEINLLDGPMMIRAIELECNESDPAKIINSTISIYWDNSMTPAVKTPFAYFFGHAFTPELFQSLFIGNTNGAYYNFLPMPYKKKARIKINSNDNFECRLKIITQKMNIQNFKDSAYFHINYQEELPTESGLYYPWLNINGLGHYVGIYLATEGRQNEPIWLEGDEIINVDNQLVIHGTGTEDYFNCGWYAVNNRLNKSGTFPLHGFPLYQKNGNEMKVVAYRWHLSDPVPFQKSINAKIEHGGQNDINANYRSAVFFYEIHPSQLVSKMDLPVNEDCVNYLQERIWQLADGNLDNALQKLDQLLESNQGNEYQLLIHGLKDYITGLKNNDSSKINSLNKKIQQLQDMIQTLPEQDIQHQETLTKSLTLLNHVKANLEHKIMLSDGLDPGEDIILESTNIWGEATKEPFYQESTDFTYSSAKVNDIRLLGKGTRFTRGNTAPSYAKFTPEFPREGYYQVFVNFSFGANAGDTKYIIHHTYGISTVPVEQRGRPGTFKRNNDSWINLGIYRFHKGLNPDLGSVVLDVSPGIAKPNQENEYRAYADSIKFVYLYPELMPVHGDTIENFEKGDLRNWEIVSGDLFQQPVKSTRRGVTYNQEGNYFIGTAETGGSDVRDYDDVNGVYCVPNLLSLKIISLVF